MGISSSSAGTNRFKFSGSASSPSQHKVHPGAVVSVSHHGFVKEQRQPSGMFRISSASLSKIAPMTGSTPVLEHGGIPVPDLFPDFR
jgi:hypothetical protein